MRGPESSSGLLGTTGWLGAQEEAGRAGGAEKGPEGVGRGSGPQPRLSVGLWGHCKSLPAARFFSSELS